MVEKEWAEKSAQYFTERKEISERTIAELRLDETGTIKEQYYYKDFGDLIIKSVDFDEHGHATLNPKWANTQIMWATARDLARANTEGGHFIGDMVLKKSAKAIIDCAKAAQVEDLQVYHLGRADFAAIYKGSNKDASQIETDLDSRSIQYLPNSIKAHISALNMSLEEATEFYNSSLETSGIKDVAPVDVLKQAQKNFTTRTNQQLAFWSEYIKMLDTFADLNMLQSAAKNPENALTIDTPVTQEQVQEYFGKYVAPLFRGTEIQYLSDFDRSDINIANICFKTAYSRVYASGTIPLRVWEKLQGAVFEKAQANYMLSDIQNKSALDEMWRDIEQSSSTEKLAENFQREQHVFVNRQGLMLGEFCRIESGIPESLDDQHISMRNLDDLVYLTSLVSKYFPKDQEMQDRLQYITERCMNIREILRKRDAGESVASDWTVVNDVEAINRFRSFSKSFEEELLNRFDRLTGFPNKDMFERTMHKWHAETPTKGEFGLVSIDMGYVKYFNIMGTRETGDLGINKVAYIIEEALTVARDAGIEVEAFRTGGDEFQLMVRGAPENLEKVAKIIKDLNHAENPITGKPNGLVPRHPNAKPAYNPEILSFDIGTAHLRETRDLLRQITELPPTTSPFSVEDETYFKKYLQGEPVKDLKLANATLTEIQLKLADQIIVANKEKSRFEMLIKRFDSITRDEQTADVPLEPNAALPIDRAHIPWIKFQNMIIFSGKSMLNKGVADFERVYRIAEQRGINIQEMSQEQRELLSESFYGERTSEPNPLEEIVRDATMRKFS